MFCGYCGTKIDGNPNFCPNCGGKIDNAGSQTVKEDPAFYSFEEEKQIDFSSQPTKRNLHRMGGPVWLVILGSLWLLAFLILVSVNEPSGAVVVFLFGSAALAGGIVLTVRFKKVNNEVVRKLRLQRCEVECSFCRNTVRYSGMEPRLHSRWVYGYIICPNCRRIIGHSVSNIKSIDK